MEGNSRGDILRTIGWFLVSIAGLGVIGRSGVKAGVIRRFGADDVFIGLAFVRFLDLSELNGCANAASNRSSSSVRWFACILRLIMA
jgi:hypothetical protein